MEHAIKKYDKNKFFMQFPKVESRLIFTEAWVFEPKKRWKLLQLIAWKMLRKTGGLRNFYENKSFVVDQVIINGDDALEAIRHAREIFLEEDRHPSRIIIGRKDLEEIMGNAQISKISETVSLVGCSSGAIYDIPITIIPHMRGVVVY